MKQLLRIVLLVSITALMASCKLAVIVVEGGQVRSTGSGTCLAGSICIVDVTDPGFSESFTAVPGTGWYFQKWNSGGGFFCGGQTSATCQLSFQDYEETKAVADMVASSELFYLMPVFKPWYQDIITVNGNEWLQPAYFIDVTRKEINAVCPEGICAGKLNGYDMTGWTWASVEDVNALFNYYIADQPFDYCGRDVSKVFGPGPDSCHAYDYCPTPGYSLCGQGPHPTWATAFYGDGWKAILADGGIRDYSYISGWMRPQSESGVIYAGGIRDNLLEGYAVFDMAFTNETPEPIWPRVEVGAWVYRTP